MIRTLAHAATSTSHSKRTPTAAVNFNIRHPGPMKQKALLPFALFFALGLLIWSIGKLLRYSVGCPLFGDCYLPGWWAHNLFEMLMVTWVVLLPLVVLRLVRRAIDL